MAILPPALMTRWIGDEPLPDPKFEALTAPAPEELLTEHDVSRYVSNSRNEGPECVAAPEPGQTDWQPALR